MKRSKTGIVFVIIGLVLVLLAPVWKWGVVPTVVKIPDTLDTTMIYEGVLTLNVDPASMSPLPPDMAVKVPLTITRIDVSDKAKGTNKIAAVKETVVAKGPGNKDFISYTKYYAMDRKTAKNVSGHNSDQNRTDYSLALGFFVNKDKGYAVWDDDVAAAGQLEYVKTVKLDGFKYKNIDVLVFKASSSGAKTLSPPLGMPSKVSGAQIKAVLNNPSLPFNDTQMYPIDYIKATTATMAADQMTGTLLDLISYKDEFYVDASAMGMGKIKIGQIAYKQTPENVKDNLDVAAKNYMLLNSVEIYLPLLLLILGVIALVIGLALIIVKKAS